MRMLLAVAVLLLIVAVVWTDVVTGFWQNIVVLSGIAAGLLTFVLTALLLEPSMARTEHLRWFPLSRIALSYVVHSMADEEASELSRGKVVPKTFTVPDPLTTDHADDLLDAVVRARDGLAEALGRWAGFLVASAEVPVLMRHVSQIAEHLDAIRDDVLEFEKTPDPNREAALRASIDNYHAEVHAAVAELTELLRRTRN